LWGQGAYERETIDGSQTAARTLSLVRAHDLIINKIWVRNGSVSIAGPDVDGCAASNEFPTFLLDDTKIATRWMYWLTRMADFSQRCADLSRGTSGKNRVRPEQFLNVQIPLPPLAEQRRIVARIDELAGKIGEALRLGAETLRDANTLIASLNTDLARGATVRLKDIIALEEHREDILPGASYPQVGLRGFGGGMFSREPVEASNTTYRYFNRLYSGALVLSQVKGWEGAVTICPEYLTTHYASPEYRTFRCRPDQALPAYLAVLVSTPWFYSRLASLTRGVGARRERIRPEQFLELEIALPSIDEQERGVQVFAAIQALSSRCEARTDELASLLPAILDRTFAGEL